MSRKIYHSPGLALLPPWILSAAHVMAVIAILSFGARTGGYPLHTLGLIFYWVTVALSTIGLVVQAHKARFASSEIATLLLLSLPAFASLVFRAGLWMTPSLGGSLYAPYKPGELDAVVLFSAFFAIFFLTLSILYNSFSYLIVAGTVQIALYFCTYALPHHLRYPDAFLGINPFAIGVLVGIYSLGAVLLFLKSSFFGRQKTPWWVAATLSAFTGAWILYKTLAWLPGNGAHLGYVDALLYVPELAWNWTRPAAQGMSIIAMAVAVLNRPLLFCCTAVKRRLERNISV